MSPYFYLAAWRYEDEKNITQCNDSPEQADGFGIYAANPQSLHLKDFTVLDIHSENILQSPVKCRKIAYDQASSWALSLSTHLNLQLEVRCRPPL